ncbi:MAG TPA: DUF429 domain-containing protein [Acidobacteriota bacterium]|nr:DUF429 domain-containing protein [Acidobacteriota bacterium]
MPVAGIDVGGVKKGYHAVVLENGLYCGHFCSKETVELVDWCCRMKAQVIAIDAPCRWSKVHERSRPAERELLGEGIWCFSTPTQEQAIHHPTNHYGWMIQGIKLYKALEKSYPLCDQLPYPASERFCFETFPHAITYKLTASPVSARDKRLDRILLLKKAGIVTIELSSIDLVDAALCALAAHLAASNAPCKLYGESSTGFIIVPTFLPAAI